MNFLKNTFGLFLKLTFGAIFVIALVTLFLAVPSTPRVIILGFITAIMLALIVVGLMTPLFIDVLVNKPIGTNKSGFHLFTYPEEGKVKIVVRGDRLVRMIMLFADHTFAKQGPKDSPEYWEIVKTPGKSQDPLMGIKWYLLPWASYVYRITGAVFTGIYPFQRVREYTIERTKMTRDEKTADKRDNIILEVKTDISDHFRVRQFIYPFRVVSADTKDKVAVNVLAVIKAHITNPHKAAFATDRWDLQLVNLATNATTNYTRSNDLGAVLTADGDLAVVTGLNDAILLIKNDEKEYGLDMDGVDVIDISPNLDDKEKAKLYAEALAKPVGKATIIDGQARAQNLRDLNEANAAGGEFALETMRTEAAVRAAAAAAQGGTVILSIGGAAPATDPTQAAILAELKKLNDGKGATT